MIKNPRLMSILEALLVTFLWSSSYVLVKIGLRGMSPLAFAAVRYSLAAVVVLGLSLTRHDRGAREKLGLQGWLKLILAGAAGYAVAQGLQFVGLNYLPAVTVTFLLNFTPLFVTVIGISFLDERPTSIQVAGMVVALAGAYLYFLTPISASEVLGVVVVLVSGLGWAIYMIMIRGFQKKHTMSTSRLTATTMSVGAIALLVSALTLEGVPTISLLGWAIIVWLSLVNTAFAFYVWNHVLRKMKAFELSILQNTMLVQIAVLAFFFLGEQLTINNVSGIIFVLVGVTLVQLQTRR
ncbi:MAG: DMT family transporter [archaeon]